MAKVTVVFSSRASRSDLMLFLKTPELIRLFENLLTDVSLTLPEAVGAVASDADSVLKMRAFTREITTPREQNAAVEFNWILPTQVFGP